MMIESNYRTISDDWTLQTRHSGWHKNSNEMHKVSWRTQISEFIYSEQNYAYSISFLWYMFL